MCQNQTDILPDEFNNYLCSGAHNLIKTIPLSDSDSLDNLTVAPSSFLLEEFTFDEVREAIDSLKNKITAYIYSLTSSPLYLLQFKRSLCV